MFIAIKDDGIEKCFNVNNVDYIDWYNGTSVVFSHGGRSVFFKDYSPRQLKDEINKQINLEKRILLNND